MTKLNLATQDGVGLLEVLIALIVVSVGILSLAGMQLNGMRVAKGSFSRSQAVFYTETMIDQMRANPDGVALMRYAGLDSSAVNCGTLPATYCYAYPGVDNPPSCVNSSIRAENDFFSVACGHWTGSKAENGVKDTLPEGEITIACDDAGACDAESSYTITVNWVETEIMDGVDVESPKTVSMRVMP